MFGYICMMWTLSSFSSCTPPTDADRDGAPPFSIDFSDTSFVSLWYAQVRNDTGMIQKYLDANDPMRQYAALMALSTTPSTQFAPSLIQLLQSPHIEIRTRAAYSLGQMGTPSSLPDLKQAFDIDDSLMQRQHYNATILESSGRLGGPKEAMEMITVSTYSPRDSILNLGRLRGLYHIAQNGHELKEVKHFMLNVIAQPLHPREAHYIAADYLARFSSDPLDTLQFGLIRTFEKTIDIQLKRQLARSLPNCSSSRANELLASAFANAEEDPTLRFLCGRGLLKDRPQQSNRFFKNILGDPNTKISQLAARYFLQYGNQHDALDYAEWARKESFPKSTRFILYAAALENLPFYYQLSKRNITKELLAFWPNDMSRADRKILIEQLVSSGDFFEEVVAFALKAEDGIIRTDILIALQNEYCTDGSCNFSDSQRKTIIPLLKKSIEGETSTQTVSAEIATELGVDRPQDWASDSSFVLAVYQSLEWPRQIEAGKALELLLDSLDISYVKRKKVAAIKPYGRIWERMSDSTQLVVKLEQGEIRIALYPHEAPLTVAQLIAEVESGYYDGKAWHRVVPNFVVQTGCPTGHGYDSGDFLLPTETSPYAHYHNAGSCGMASIGPHTESNQWFITLRATPHLDGRYTKWGQVIFGIELLNDITAGSIIKSMHVENLSK